MSMGSIPNKTEEKKTEEKKKKTASAVKALSEKTGLGKYGEGLLFACMIVLFISVCGIIFMFTKALQHCALREIPQSDPEPDPGGH